VAAARSPIGAAALDVRQSPTGPVGNLFSDMDDLHPAAAPVAKGGRRKDPTSSTDSSERRRGGRWWNPSTWGKKTGSGPMDQISEEVTEVQGFGDDGPRGAGRSTDDKVPSFDY
jgi:hypothetical protein